MITEVETDYIYSRLHKRQLREERRMWKSFLINIKKHVKVANGVRQRAHPPYDDGYPYEEIVRILQRSNDESL